MKSFIPWLAALLLCSFPAHSQDTLVLPHADAILYTGTNASQPLVVGLGGSEGGNAWASRRWKQTRDRFLEKGYAFLAVGYFKTKNSPPLLEKIALEDVYSAITAARKNAKVNGSKIAVIGGSRGADLALLLAAHYGNISCVIGLSPSHAVFPGNTDHLSTSSWTFQNKELSFVPVNEAALPFILNGNLRAAFSTMLLDSLAEQRARIPVENIKGNILLISGTNDEICPSTSMCNKMVEKLSSVPFPYYYEHLATKGGHAQPLQHFEMVFTFLEKYFSSQP